MRLAVDKMRLFVVNPGAVDWFVCSKLGDADGDAGDEMKVTT